MCWGWAAWQEESQPSSPPRCTSVSRSLRTELPVTFLCQSFSPLSLPSFLRLTLFSALSFGSNLQVVRVPLTLTAETQKLFPVLCPHHTHSATLSPGAVRASRGLPAPHHSPRPSQGPWVPSCLGTVPPSSSLPCPHSILLVAFALFLFFHPVFPTRRPRVRLECEP